MNDHDDDNEALARAKEAVTRVTLAQRSDTARAMKKPTPARTIKMALRAFKRAGKAVAEVLKQVPPPAPIQRQAANGVGYGLYAGLTDAGFPVEDVEMTAALALGLADRDIAKRWLKGEPVFRPATAAQAPTAVRRSSPRSVFSQVKLSPERPKWP